jgi:hypothetical protein
MIYTEGTHAMISDQRTVVVVKPGYDTIRLGPLSAATARDWARSLEMKLHQTAPEGTIIEVTSYNPGAGPHIDPASIPRTVEDLIEPMRADPGHPENGGFPDLYDRLVLAVGETRAGELWTQAGNAIDQEAAYEEACAEAAADLAAAFSVVSEAQAAAERAAVKIAGLRRRIGEWELDISSLASGDALHHAESAARNLRAALRALGEAKP